MPREIERGQSLPVPCRHCGRFIDFKVDESQVVLSCPACGKQTSVTCRRKGADWVLTTARIPAASVKRNS
jgi:predicted RNA-binding Zn-ribbon protein involved in translation (DUF1610 family)